MKQIYLISILAFFSFNLFCQDQWTDPSEKPLLLPGAFGEWDQKFIAPGSVIYYQNEYHMWYGGGSLSKEDTVRIGHATSPDGIIWTKDAINPVLDVGLSGEWDEKNVFKPCVLLVDTIFHMWYSGHNGENLSENFRVGYATSPDGVNWTRDAKNPVMDMGQDGEWDDAWVCPGSVVFDGTDYHLWYQAYGNGDYGCSIGHAVSPDGVNWSRDAQNPVLTSEAGTWAGTRVDCPYVILDGETYHMWYAGGKYFEWQIGYATSEDGSSWTPDANNPVIKKGFAGNWDTRSVAWPVVIDSMGCKYKMWYSGCITEGTGSIGYAEYEMIVGMEKVPSDNIRVYPNPVNDLLTIETDNSGQHTIEIHSLTGQLLGSNLIDEPSKQIDLSSFQKGIYLITIRSRDFVKTDKIIKL